MTVISDPRTLFQHVCENAQKKICTALEGLETGSLFQTHNWERPGGGGGTMALLNGTLFEKAGVNTSTVYGTFSPEFQKKIPGCENDPSFWASGLSLVIHPKSPHVPIIHMNVRHIQTQKHWFGGGIDLTPTYPNTEDTSFFHQTLKEVCDRFDPAYYPRFKKWADDYFWIPHRKEPRGVGGIFYDTLILPFEKGLAFTQAVANTFIPLYTHLVQKHQHTPTSPKEQEDLFKKRGRYVEFNLIYDRGTTFGLKTDGNIEAILMSLPPLAAWPSPFNDTHEKKNASNG